MITRRSFFRTGTVAAASLWASGSAFASASQEGASHADSGHPLPPAIAALKSLRDEVKPITVDERKQRIARALQLAQQNALAAVIITPGTSLRYFSGIRWQGGERLFSLVLPASGKAFVVCPAFEHDRAMEQVDAGPLKGEAEVFTWQEDESPYALVAAQLKARGVSSGNVGVSEDTPFLFSDGLAKAMPTVKIISATPVTAGCRMHKTEHELQLMRTASKATWLAYKATYESLQAGMDQNDVARLVEQAHAQQGFEGGAFVVVGEYSALPHGTIVPQKIREGTIILMDGGCNVEGYASDLTRTFVLGKPTERMKQVFDVVHRAQSAALATARPGIAAGDVDAAARKVITDAGFGPDYRLFSHRVGHGIGMDGHEWPYLVRGNKLILEPNMTFSDEPGIYIRGEFGIRLEDDMLITAKGAELLSPQSTSLESPFATT